MVTIKEALKGAESLLFNETSVGVGQGRETVRAANALIEKGYGPNDDYGMIQDFGGLSNVPAKANGNKTATITGKGGIELVLNIDEIKEMLDGLKVNYQPQTGLKKLAAKLQEELAKDKSEA